MRDIHIVGLLYDRQVEVARFMWYLQTEVELRIQDQFRDENFADKYVELLSLKELILLMLYQNAMQLGEHLFITDHSDVDEPSSK